MQEVNAKLIDLVSANKIREKEVDNVEIAMTNLEGYVNAALDTVQDVHDKKGGESSYWKLEYHYFEPVSEFQRNWKTRSLL